jgi:hypothetical protein
VVVVTTLFGPSFDAQDAPVSSHVPGFADVVERMFCEFEGPLDLLTIEAVCQQCRRDLCCSPALALPELIERLARERLNKLVGPLAI